MTDIEDCVDIELKVFSNCLVLAYTIIGPNLGRLNLKGKLTFN